MYGAIHLGQSKKYYPKIPRIPNRFSKKDPVTNSEKVIIFGAVLSGSGLITMVGSVAGVGLGILNPIIPIIGAIIFTTGWFTMVAGTKWPNHAPTSIDVKNYPSPEWLTKNINIGVVGRTSSGKSSFINALFGEKVAETGIGETTMVPTDYVFRDGLSKSKINVKTIVWDCPGFGTKNFPSTDKYILTTGLRYYSSVILCISDAINNMDISIVNHLNRNKVPFVIARTKMDECFKNEKRDHGKSMEQVSQEILKETSEKLKVLHKDIFLITSNVGKIEKYNIANHGWSEFVTTLTTKIKNAYSYSPDQIF